MGLLLWEKPGDGRCSMQMWGDVVGRKVRRIENGTVNDKVKIRGAGSGGVVG